MEAPRQCEWCTYPSLLWLWDIWGSIWPNYERAVSGPLLRAKVHKFYGNAQSIREYWDLRWQNGYFASVLSIQISSKPKFDRGHRAKLEDAKEGNARISKQQRSIWWDEPRRHQASQLEDPAIRLKLWKWQSWYGNLNKTKKRGVRFVHACGPKHQRPSPMVLF